MTKMNQFSKTYRRNTSNSRYNTRRFAENFPLLERKVDIVDFEYPFDMEFNTSDHPHTATLDLAIREPEFFRCSQKIITDPLSTYCEATGYSYDYQSTTFTYTYLGETFEQVSVDTGDAKAVIYSSFISNQSDFEFHPSGGIIVPKGGHYNVNFTTGSSFLTLDDLSAAVASVRKNGVIINQVIWSVRNGKLTPPTTYNSLDVNIWGLCIEAHAGDILGGFMSSIALYGADFTSGSTRISLIGAE